MTSDNNNDNGIGDILGFMLLCLIFAFVFYMAALHYCGII